MAATAAPFDPTLLVAVEKVDSHAGGFGSHGALEPLS